MMLKSQLSKNWKALENPKKESALNSQIILLTQFGVLGIGQGSCEKKKEKVIQWRQLDFYKYIKFNLQNFSTV